METNLQQISVSDNERQYAMLIHLTQFAGLLVPLGGWLVPLILWLIKRKESTYIDQHGKIVMNWILSCLIYGFICFILSFILIGVFLAVALGICSIVFTIIGALKANNGERWAYPLSIPFLK